jgi:outer membrane protein TolC
MVAFSCGKFANIILASVMLGLLSATSVSAQDYAPGQKKYSLQQFIDSAEKHLPALLQKKALVDAARAGVTEARHQFLPNSTIGDELVAATDNSVPGSYISFGIIPSSSSGVRPANIYQPALGNIAFLYNDYELLDFGLKRATVKRAEAFTDLSQADLRRESYLVQWQVGKLYLQLLKSEFQTGIDLENVSRYDTIFSVIRALTGSGIKPGADSSLAKAELSRTRITYNQNMGQLEQLKEQLSFLTGIPTPEITVDTGATQDYLSIRSLVRLMPGDSTAANPITDYYDKQKALYHQTEELVRKSYLPKLLLTGVVWGRGSTINYPDDYGSTIAGLGYQRFNYLGGLTLHYNLFNGVHRKDREDVIHNDLLASDYDLQQQVLALQNVGKKADAGIRSAMLNLREAPIQIGAARDAYDQKAAQYKAGLINLVDLTNASFVLYRSQSDYVQTLSDWLLASLDKYASEGQLDQFTQTIK